MLYGLSLRARRVGVGFQLLVAGQYSSGGISIGLREAGVNESDFDFDLGEKRHGMGIMAILPFVEVLDVVAPFPNSEVKIRYRDDIFIIPIEDGPIDDWPELDPQEESSPEEDDLSQ